MANLRYGDRGRIGVLLPSGNVVAEVQLRAMIPADVSLHVTRLPLNGSSDAELLRMVEAVPHAAALLADAKVDHILFNCTAVSTWSQEMEARILATIVATTDIPASATSQALTAAVRAVKADRIVLVTPYKRAINLREMAFLRSWGFEVLGAEGLDLDTPSEMEAVPPEQWIDILRRARRVDADVYLISCTAIRSAEIIAALEAELDRPVLTSNQAAAWWATRSLGINQRLQGFGRLFELDP
jgi:maleate isomerase